MLRWTVVSIILVCLRDNYALQIQLNIAFSVLFQCLIVIQKPYEDSTENVFLMFNEVTVTMYLYCLILLSDYNEQTEFNNNLGLCLLSVVILALAVNLLKFLVTFLKSIFRFLHRHVCNDRCFSNYEKKEDPSKSSVVAIRPNLSMATDHTTIDASN